MAEEDDEYRQALIDRHFIGSQFDDRLYNIDSNVRERACGWKLLRAPHRWYLTNGSFYWQAVGIPLDLVEKGEQGDLDLAFCMRTYNPAGTGGARFNRVYRVLELKTAKISSSGEVWSLKEAKFHKVIGQLAKLLRIGVPQVFLLDIFILEAGYSDRADALPDRVRATIAQRIESLAASPCGYAVGAIEQIVGYHEEDTGKAWPVEALKDADTLEIGTPFAAIVAHIEAFIERRGGLGGNSVVTFCYQCRSLTCANRVGPYQCEICGAPLL